jgi:hypothetical protein
MLDKVQDPSMDDDSNDDTVIRDLDGLNSNFENEIADDIATESANSRGEVLASGHRVLSSYQRIRLQSLSVRRELTY